MMMIMEREREFPCAHSDQGTSSIADLISCNAGPNPIIDNPHTLTVECSAVRYSHCVWIDDDRAGSSNIADQISNKTRALRSVTCLSFLPFLFSFILSAVLCSFLSLFFSLRFDHLQCRLTDSLTDSTLKGKIKQCEKHRPCVHIILLLQ